MISKLKIFFLLTVTTIIFIGSIGTYLFFTPYAYVSFENKTASLYTLNIFQYIIKEETQSQEGQPMLSSSKYQKIDTALLDQLLFLEQTGQNNNTSTNTILIAATSKIPLESQKIAARLENLIQTSSYQKNMAIKTIIKALPEDEFHLAYNAGLSIGQYQLLELIKNALAEKQEAENSLANAKTKITTIPISKSTYYPIYSTTTIPITNTAPIATNTPVIKYVDDDDDKEDHKDKDEKDEKDDD